MGKAAISIKNLEKKYELYEQPLDRVKEALNPFRKSYHKTFHAIKDLNLEIKKGEVVGIIGRNGCGKSTLLKMVTGVLTPTSGSIIVDGKISAILELGTGFNPELTGRKNIHLNMAINGLSQPEIVERSEDVIAFAELGDFIDQPVKTYSSGMSARLSFAVAINIDPDVFIVDEALSVGDAVFQRKCFAKMEKIRKKGATVLFVSHSEASIVNLCDRAIWLNCGEQVLDGSPKIVTGLYLKYSNTEPLDRALILSEYQELKENDDSEEELSCENKCRMKEFYDPELLSKSAMSYLEKGARISNVKVTTLAGEKVNILYEGTEYLYSYEVDFFEYFKNLIFGMMIKTVTGVHLGGGAYSHEESLNSSANKRTIVTFKFKCSLNAGEYFFNAGVQGGDEENIDFLHRILDAYVVKVLTVNTAITESVNFVESINVKVMS